jgi:cell division protein FtsL
VRIPPFNQYERFFAGFGIFIVGTVVGSAIFMAVYQYNFSLLSIQNQHMRTEMDNLISTNKNLTLKQSKAASTKIQSIKVLFEQKTEPNKLDEISENVLRKKILQDLQFLSGKPIATLKQDPLLYRNLIEGKTYHAIQERDYIISVRTLMVVETELTLSISAILARE